MIGVGRDRGAGVARRRRSSAAGPDSPRSRSTSGAPTPRASPYNLTVNYVVAGLDVRPAAVHRRTTFDFGASDIHVPARRAAGSRSRSAAAASRRRDVLRVRARERRWRSRSCTTSPTTRATGSPNLKLTRRAACKIFTGAITKWNDPEIVATNPQLAGRSTATSCRSSAPTARARATCSPSSASRSQPDVWHAFIATGSTRARRHRPDADFPAGQPTSNWPQKAGARQPGVAFADGTANYVADPIGGPNAITYVAAGYAKVRSFPVASVQNAAGVFTQPDEDNVTVALGYATGRGDGTFKLHFNGPDPRAYFPSTYSYVLAQTAGFDPGKGATLAQFLCYAVSKGQVIAPQLRYARLSSVLVEHRDRRDRPDPRRAFGEQLLRPRLSGSSSTPCHRGWRRWWRWRRWRWRRWRWWWRRWRWRWWRRRRRKRSGRRQHQEGDRARRGQDRGRQDRGRQDRGRIGDHDDHRSGGEAAERIERGRGRSRAPRRAVTTRRCGSSCWVRWPARCCGCSRASWGSGPREDAHEGSRRAARALSGAVLAGVLLTAVAGPSEGATTPKEAVVTLSGSGSWGSYQEMPQWKNDMFGAPAGVEVHYAPHGSLLGREDLLNGQADFAFSGVPFSKAELAKAGNPELIDAPLQVSSLAFILDPPQNGLVQLDQICDPSDPPPEFADDPDQCLVRTPYTGPVRFPPENLSAVMFNYPSGGAPPLRSWSNPATLRAWGFQACAQVPLPPSGCALDATPRCRSRSRGSFRRRRDPGVPAGLRQDRGAESVAAAEGVLRAGQDRSDHRAAARPEREHARRRRPATAADAAGGRRPDDGFARLHPHDRCDRLRPRFDDARARALHDDAGLEFVQVQNANGDWVAPTPDVDRRGGRPPDGATRCTR